MQTEINPRESYKKLTLVIITNLSRYHKGKPFSKMKRADIISFLDTVKKTDDQDPMHKWIGTYNLYLTCVTRFFKWLYFPGENHRSRPKLKAIENISQLKRREISGYKPSDLWTLEDDFLFLKWCPNTRDRCYHAISRDMSARPHEILNLKIKDIIFKVIGDKQYAECLVNGKTGTRQLPIIDSLPYVKDWLNIHPQRNNPKSYLFCTNDRRFSHRSHVTVRGLHRIYDKYKKRYFPKLLSDTKISTSEKEHIRDLLAKPWNPYIRRHSALTEKSKYLKESTLRQHAGWSGRSQMQLKYVHYFGNESSESILEEYGIIPKEKQLTDALRPKQCPNCNEPNKPDSRFCANCRMVLTYDAYSETLEKQQEKESEMQKLREKQEQDMRAMREEMENKFQQILAKIDVATLK
jgi:integrase/recombinase XerD